MSESMSRRQMLRAVGSAGTLIVLGRRQAVLAAPPSKIESVTVISMRPHLYHGWPTVARRRNGELLVVCSGGREGHVCPYGWVELMRSKDEGRTWSWPRVLWDSAIDDRDAGVLETARGTLLVTTFTSLAYEDRLGGAHGAQHLTAAQRAEEAERWQAASQRIDAAQREGELGSWILRSRDGGVTWSAPYRSPIKSPHGPIQLSDGRLLYAGKQMGHSDSRIGYTGDGRIGVCESTDDGQSWRWLAEIPSRTGDSHREYWELHAVEAVPDRLLVHIRNHNKANVGETLQTESTDGGRTWSSPHPIGVWGLPAHLLRLSDGRLVMTYGYRRKPFGNQARVSEDQGETWSEPIVISDDGASFDLGYPSSVQLSDGSLLTVWYELREGSSRAVLRQARWSIGS